MDTHEFTPTALHPDRCAMGCGFPPSAEIHDASSATDRETANRVMKMKNFYDVGQIKGATPARSQVGAEGERYLDECVSAVCAYNLKHVCGRVDRPASIPVPETELEECLRIENENLRAELGQIYARELRSAEVGTEGAVNDLVAQVQRMLEREAYHYCADCHTHCRQLLITVEGFKEACRQLRSHSVTVEALADALQRIERWFGEFPDTGRFWDAPKNTEPMSYVACFGSNGERDYMRQVARNALAILGWPSLNPQAGVVETKEV